MVTARTRTRVSIDLLPNVVGHLDMTLGNIMASEATTIACFWITRGVAPVRIVPMLCISNKDRLTHLVLPLCMTSLLPNRVGCIPHLFPHLQLGCNVLG